jgi:hypothetical protein
MKYSSYLIVCVWLLSSCGPQGSGTLNLRVGDSERTVLGFSPGELVDRWSLTFSKYLVSIGDWEIQRDVQRLSRRSMHVVDLKQGARSIGPWSQIPAGRWGVAFSVRPPPPDIQAEGIALGDIDEMRQNRWAYLIEGQAIKTGVGTFPFRIGLALSHRYQDCTNGIDGTQGLVVSDGSTETLETTIHVEHMLFDRLGTHRGTLLRFAAWVADTAPGQLVSLPQLERQDLLRLIGRDGQTLVDADGQPVVYQPGSFDVRTLAEFVAQSMQDQAHLNGGGLCRVTRVEPNAL